MNSKLLIRKPTGIEVTDAGRYFYEKATFILSQLDSLEKEIQSFSKERTITIGALPSIASYYLPSILHHFKRIGLKINVLIRDTSLQLLPLISNEEIDVCFIP